MNEYEITYETDTTPITRTVKASDPYTACMMVGRQTITKKINILRIVQHHAPETIWVGNGFGNGNTV